jgi:hypothetical protein
MDERGWGWTDSEIRQAQLVEWVAQQPLDTMFSPEEFYDALPDQKMNTWDVAHGDLQALEASSLIGLTAAVSSGIPGLHIRPRHQVRDYAADLQERRHNRPLRRSACRDAMVSWLWSRDAVDRPNQTIRSEMLSDRRHGVWFAEPFSEEDLDAAAAWLRRQGLVGGMEVEEAEGPLVVYLTDEGIKCAEHFGSDTTRYLAAKDQVQSNGPTIHIGGDYRGALQVAGDYAHQEQHIGTSAEHLREMITGLAELVRGLVPDADGIGEEQQKALAAARDGAVNRPALQRFAAWVLSVVGKGASAAVIPVVTAGTDDLLREAARLAAHL